MKKFFSIIVLLLCITIANAQSFTPVTSVSKDKTGCYFASLPSGERVGITLSDYLAMKKNCTGYFIANYEGQNGFSIVVTANEYTDEILQVASVDTANEDTLCVKFQDGKEMTTKCMDWANAIVGQKVRHIVINSKYRAFERYMSVDSAMLANHRPNVPQTQNITSTQAPQFASHSPEQMPTMPQQDITLTAVPEATVQLFAANQPVAQPNNEVVYVEERVGHKLVGYVKDVLTDKSGAEADAKDPRTSPQGVKFTWVSK